MKVFWIDPKHCDPPHRITHPQQVEGLAHSIRRFGWDGPPLTGYFDSDRVILLSGSHRFGAALSLGIRLPVKVYAKMQIDRVFGNVPEWKSVVNPNTRIIRDFKDIDKVTSSVIGS